MDAPDPVHPYLAPPSPFFTSVDSKETTLPNCILLWAMATVALCGEVKGIGSESQGSKNENQPEYCDGHYHF